MNLKEMKAQLEASLKERYGWKWPFVKYWWRLQDKYYEGILYDIQWWLTDGKAEWGDAGPCERKLCAKCGNKPFSLRRNR